MEKELFYILQDLKIDINSLNTKKLKNKIDDLYIQFMHVENNFNYYRKKYVLNNIKHLLTLGMCSKYRSEKHKYIKQNIEENLDIIDIKYRLLLSELTNIESFLEINQNKEKTFKNNFEQIDTFLNFIKNLDNDEKEKLLSYRIGG